MKILEFIAGLLLGPHRLAPVEFVARRDPSHAIVDVRTPGEFEQKHLRGAINVDVHAPDFVERVERLLKKGALKADRPIYLYCRSGARSGRATRILRARGFEEAYNVGGLRSLEAAGADVTR